MCLFTFYFNYKADSTADHHLNLELQHSMRLFRAQRNFYISGFSIFLTLVIRRLVILISSQAQLLAQSEASMRQAQSATTAARTLLSNQKTDEKSAIAKTEDKKSDDLVSFFSHFLFPAKPKKKNKWNEKPLKCLLALISHSKKI